MYTHLISFTVDVVIFIVCYIKLVQEYDCEIGIHVRLFLYLNYSSLSFELYSQYNYYTCTIYSFFSTLFLSYLYFHRVKKSVK